MVAGTPAQITVQGIHSTLKGDKPATQKIPGEGHDESGGAESALGGPLIDEGLLQPVGRLFPKALYGYKMGMIELAHRHETGRHGPVGDLGHSAEYHRAGTTLPFPAPLFDTVKPYIFSQKVQNRPARRQRQFHLIII
jgi:hypothetical protein